MAFTMDVMSGSTINRHLAQLSVLMFVKMLLQVTAQALPSEISPIHPNLEKTLREIFGDYPKDCDCVPLHLCKNETFNVYDEDIFILRSQVENPCNDTMKKCCKNAVLNPADILPKETDINSCGNWNLGGVGFKTVGDTKYETQFGEFPWMMSILNKDLRTQITMNICGGSLIHPKVVLTAAHCVHKYDEKNLVIRGGEWDTKTEAEIYKHQDRKVLKIIKHEQVNLIKGYNDVALIIVTEPFQIVEHVSTICLPTQDYEFSDQRCYTSGWGKNTFGESGTYQNILKKIDLPIVPRDPCLQLFRKNNFRSTFLLHESFMCAGGEVGKDTCTGDGGGPLMCPIDDKRKQFVLAGIVVKGMGCGTELPGLYANVAMFRNWIDEKMKNHNFETQYYDSKSNENTTIPGTTKDINFTEMNTDEKIRFIFNDQQNED